MEDTVEKVSRDRVVGAPNPRSSEKLKSVIQPLTAEDLYHLGYPAQTTLNDSDVLTVFAQNEERGVELTPVNDLHPTSRNAEDSVERVVELSSRLSPSEAVVPELDANNPTIEKPETTEPDLPEEQLQMEPNPPPTDYPNSNGPEKTTTPRATNHTGHGRIPELPRK